MYGSQVSFDYVKWEMRTVIMSNICCKQLLLPSMASSEDWEYSAHGDCLHKAQDHE